MMDVIRTHRPWYERLADRARQAWQARHSYDELQALDRRMLADIGIDASEIGSVVAESRGDVPATRRRITFVLRHA